MKVYNKMHPKPFFLVGFMDDDPAKVGKELEGFPILAGNDRLLEIIEAKAISEIVIAITGEMQGSTFQITPGCPAKRHGNHPHAQPV